MTTDAGKTGTAAGDYLVPLQSYDEALIEYWIYAYDTSTHWEFRWKWDAVLYQEPLSQWTTVPGSPTIRITS